MIKNLYIKFAFNLIILLTIFFYNFLHAEEIYFDLSEDSIELKTDFNGKEIIIFGLLKNDHETLLTIKGPPSKMRIQKKERYFGIWINNQYVTYSNIPSLFFLSSEFLLFRSKSSDITFAVEFKAILIFSFKLVSFDLIYI